MGRRACCYVARRMFTESAVEQNHRIDSYPPRFRVTDMSIRFSRCSRAVVAGDRGAFRVHHVDGARRLSDWRRSLLPRRVPLQF
jgi:hypothetical protein